MSLPLIIFIAGILVLLAGSLSVWGSAPTRAAAIQRFDRLMEVRDGVLLHTVGEALKQAQVNEEQRVDFLKRVRNAFQERAPATETRPKISVLTGRRIGLQVSPEVTIWTQVAVSLLLLAAGVWIILSSVYPPEDERWGL